MSTYAVADELKAEGVVKAVASYEGSNDDGGIDGIRFLNAKDKDVKIGDVLERQFSDIAEEQLEEAYGGWEINAGGHGTVTLNVPQADWSIDHNENDYDEFEAEEDEDFDDDD